MAELIAIVGESGSGKTSSIRNLNPEETFIISTTGKRPGIKGAKKKYPDLKIAGNEISGNFYTTANIDNIKKRDKPSSILNHTNNGTNKDSIPTLETG